MKIGDELYYASYDEEEKKVEIDIYKCRVIRKGYAYLTAFNKYTWGKRSKKNGDFGWLDPIHPVWKSKVKIGSEGQRMYAHSKGAAIRAAIASERKSRAYWSGPQFAQTQADIDEGIAALQARLRHTKD